MLKLFTIFSAKFKNAAENAPFATNSIHDFSAKDNKKRKTPPRRKCAAAAEITVGSQLAGTAVEFQLARTAAEFQLARSVSGNSTQKVLPCPTSLSTPYANPCLTRMVLTMESPSPVPLTGRLCVSVERV